MCYVLIINRLCLYILWIKRLASDKKYIKQVLMYSKVESETLVLSLKSKLNKLRTTLTS